MCCPKPLELLKCICRLEVWGCCVGEDIGLAGVVYKPLPAYAPLKLDSPPPELLG